MCHTSYITVHCTQSVLCRVYTTLYPGNTSATYLQNLNHPPLGQSALCYTDPPLLSAKTLFNAARQCSLEMKTNKELCFSILSIIILWSGCNSIGFCARHIQLHTYTLYSTGSILCRDSAYFWWSHCDLLKIL